MNPPLAPPTALVEAVRRWRREACDRACPQCPVNCCAGRLSPRLDRRERFADLPVVRWRSDPVPADGPYVVDRRNFFGGDCYLHGRCPHLEQGRCSIYQDPARPSDCEAYPLHVQPLLGGLAGHMVAAERSCWIFRDEASRREVEALARDHGTECRFLGEPVAGGAESDGKNPSHA